MPSWHLAQDLEDLLKEILALSRKGTVDPEGNVCFDVVQLNALIAKGTDKVLNYARLARIATGMLKGEAAHGCQCKRVTYI